MLEYREERTKLIWGPKLEEKKLLRESTASMVAAVATVGLKLRLWPSVAGPGGGRGQGKWGGVASVSKGKKGSESGV